MEAHPPPRPTPATRDGARGELLPLRPLPAADDLPVVVATRMSLSFPVLLSAVPLHRIDWTSRSTASAKRPACPRGDALLVLRRRHLEQLPGALLRRPAPAPADVRDQPAPVPPRPPGERGRGRERLDGPRATSAGSSSGGMRSRSRGRAARRPAAGVPRRHRAHDAEPCRRRAAADARLPRPRRAREPDRQAGRDEPHMPRPCSAR